MPVCFQLFRQGSANAQRIIDVDNAICAYLDVPADDERYVHSWYDCIGLAIACGHSWAKIGEIYKNSPKILRINHFLMENYSTEAWWEPK